MTNAVLPLNDKIGVTLQELMEMRVYVDLGKFWPEDLSVNAAYENLLVQGMKIDRRTLTAAKKGQLPRSEYATLIRLRDYARQLSGEDLSIEDIFVVREDDDE